MNEIIHLIKGYLGYDTLVIQKFIGDDKFYGDSILDVEFRNIYDYLLGFQNPIYPQIEWFKLKLRPMEDLTDEELHSIKNLLIYSDWVHGSNKEIMHVLKEQIENCEISYEVAEYLHSIHIDYQNLIGRYAIKKDQEND